MTLFIIGYLIGFIITSLIYGGWGELRNNADAMAAIILVLLWPITLAFVIFASLGAIIGNWTSRR